MRHKALTFETYKTGYIDHPNGGWRPVHANLASEYDETTKKETYLKAVDIDMICEWRLEDGKVQFIRVLFDTEEEFNAIIKNLYAEADFFLKEMKENFSEISFAEVGKDV